MGTYDIVIGNAYGDEGKGLVTDWLSTPATVVVRFSGGAQAGHTVVTPEGVRHVFHHIGSGTLAGASTFLSRFFYCDPVLFNRERAELVAKGIQPLVRVDRMAPIVTPFDVLLNQLTEKARGEGRHGSCGCGIGEAARRHEERPERLVYADLDSPLLIDKVNAIGAYVINEIERRGLLHPSMSRDDLRDDVAGCLISFMEAVPAFLEHTDQTRLRPDRLTGHVVFEGSQGLLLDRDIGAMPHVTRAKTGLANVAELLGAELFDKATVYFVSRCYSTRHGAGPLSGAGAVGPFPDATNVDNAWQGGMRFGPYNTRLLEWARSRALAEVPYPGETRIVTTCLDQLTENAGYSEYSRSWFRLRADLVSFGPTRKDIVPA